MPIKVSLVEDHHGTREHLSVLIGGSDGFECVGAHPSAESALSHVAQEKPDVVLLDLELPSLSGLECIPRLKARAPKSQIVIVTIHDDSHRIFKALEAGACGYLVKPVPPAEILEAIAEVHRGGAPMSSQIARLVIRTFHQRRDSKKEMDKLTEREVEILGLVTKGFQTKEIAGELKVTIRTVSTHLRNIYEKLHVHPRAAAAAKYLRSGR